MECTRCPTPVDARAPSGETNAYVLGSDPGLLVDPGGRTPRLDELVFARNVEHLIVTHAHADHAGEVAHYAAETEATVWARRGHVDRFRSVTGVTPDRELSAGTRLSLGGGSITVLDAPGHAPDHVALALESGRDDSILCGDCVVASGSVVVGAPEGDMRAYMTTLRRLRAMAPQKLLPGHGPVIDAPQMALDRLLAHRLERERRIEGAVTAGASSVDSVLGAAYEKDLAGVRDLARATVRAHLEKLAVEGTVTLDGDHVGGGGER